MRRSNFVIKRSLGFFLSIACFPIAGKAATSAPSSGPVFQPPASPRVTYDFDKHLNTECGINRVAVRSTRVPGKIAQTAASAGLAPATAVVSAAPVTATGGLASFPTETEVSHAN